MNSLVSMEGGSLQWVARAVISREAYVRFCERPGVKFPGPTRRSAGDRCPYADLVITLAKPAPDLTSAVTVNQHLCNHKAAFTSNPCTSLLLRALLLRCHPRQPLRAHRLMHGRFRNRPERILQRCQGFQWPQTRHP